MSENFFRGYDFSKFTYSSFFHDFRVLCVILRSLYSSNFVFVRMVIQYKMESLYSCLVWFTSLHIWFVYRSYQSICFRHRQWIWYAICRVSNLNRCSMKTSGYCDKISRNGSLHSKRRHGNYYWKIWSEIAGDGRHPNYIPRLESKK